ncbi:ABC transporter ATP-binding protein [Bacillus carboniphilus]|uniref:ABC transporter ATP-binding protein n=1 Tax=Bacillus carboniphilus TaxID=86663 RepID=A0ABP3G2S6_9BACI
MNNIVTVDIQSAGYEKKKPMIKDVQFSIQRGEIVGLIGPNGAGKSTTIQSLLGLLEFVDGSVSWEEKMRLSYIPEKPLYYDDLTLREHIDFLLTVENTYDKESLELVDELLEIFKLKDFQHQLPATFSKGMQQKGMIVFALMTKPDFYLIDEPFIGLDPNATKKLLELLQSEINRGAGILMSTHVLDTAEKICDRFLLLNQGELLAKGTLQELNEKKGTPMLSLLDLFEVFTEDR